MSQNSILELEFKTDTGLGNRANIGIIVLRTDQTLEHEFSIIKFGRCRALSFAYSQRNGSNEGKPG